MRVSVCSFFMILFHYSYEQKSNCKIPDHSWRPFTGYVPPDAFVTGPDCHGNDTYVGIVSFKNDAVLVTPVQIFQGDVTTSFTWDKSEPIHESNTFFHILCVKNKESLRWTPVTSTPDVLRRRCCLVEAGVAKFNDVKDSTVTFYVGRVVRNGTAYVGRVYDRKGMDGVSYMINRDPETTKKNYAVLTYDCEKEQ